MGSDLRFREGVNVRIVGVDGKVIASHVIPANNGLVSVPIPPLPPGRYYVEYEPCEALEEPADA